MLYHFNLIWLAWKHQNREDATKVFSVSFHNSNLMRFLLTSNNELSWNFIQVCTCSFSIVPWTLFQPWTFFHPLTIFWLCTLFLLWTLFLSWTRFRLWTPYAHTLAPPHVMHALHISSCACSFFYCTLKSLPTPNSMKHTLPL